MTSLTTAERTARKIINGWTCGAAAVGWIPGSCFILTPSDIAMIALVAETFEVEKYSEEALLGTLTAHFSGHATADICLSFIPVAGWIIKAGVAAAVTKAAGEIIINYFKDRSPHNPRRINSSLEGDSFSKKVMKPFANVFHSRSFVTVHVIKAAFDIKEENFDKVLPDIIDSWDSMS